MPPRAKPWSKTKAERRVLSPDEAWAAELEERILRDCHPFQRDAVIDDAARVSYLTNRGAGKTSAMRARAMRKMAKLKRQRLVYLAESRPHAEELMWLPLKDSCDALGLVPNVDVMFNESKLRCTFLRTGSTYRLVGADDKREVNKLRGQPIDELDIDEGASHYDQLLRELVFRAAGPRMRGAIVLGGTPGHILDGLFYEVTYPGLPKHSPYRERDRRPPNWKGWSSHVWTTEMVAALPKAEQLYPGIVEVWRNSLEEKERERWSDDNPIWRREHKGEWAADNTTNVFKYSEEKNRWDPWGAGEPLESVPGLRVALAELARLHDGQAGRPHLTDWHFVTVMDMGTVDRFACNVFAFSPSDPARNVWHVMFFERPGFYAKPIAELLLGPELSADKPSGVFGVIGWPDGIEMDSDNATIGELQNVYGIRATKAEKKSDYKIGAIELTNGDLVDGRIRVLKGSPLEKQMQRLQWKVDDFGRVAEDKAQANHSSDTMVYGRRLIARLFEAGVVAQEPTKPPYRDPMGLGGDPPSDPPREESGDGDRSDGYFDIWNT